jgi:PAS domain S-box-containing protein
MVTESAGEGLLEPSQDTNAEWLRVTLSSIGDAVITSDSEGRVTFLNPVGESLTGWAMADAMGQPLGQVIAIVNEDTRQAVELPTVGALREDGTFQLASHSLLIARDGSERPISDSAALIRNDQGEVAGIVLVFRDITERRVSERALDKSLAFADDIIATLREPFIVLDRHLRIKTANRAFYADFQVTPEDTENCLLFELGDGQWDIPRLRAVLGEVLSSKSPIRDFEVEHSFATLGRKTILVNARSFPSDSANPELILLAVEDVSNLRERADELTEADRHKNEFLAILAHELRNPLAPIRNALQILRLTGTSAESLQTASEMMERQVGQMVRLVDDLLDVSRVSSGKIELRKEHTEIRETVRQIVETVRPMHEAMEHELSVSLPAHPIYLNADPARLAQIVGNLLNNACKFTERGGRISLTVNREGQHVVVRVRDSGVGIAPEELVRIFHMFTQVDTSLERPVNGLGIGLTLVKSLVELHGGTIDARSEGLGRGSEFIVCLPASPDPPDGVPETPVAALSIKARRVLVVDDNRDSAESLAMLLRLRGHHADIAFDAAAALEAAQSLRPEVVLLDIGMPRMNGYEVCNQIREQPWGKDMLVVAVTGWGQPEDRQRSRAAGFDHHLVKPAELDDVMRILAEKPRAHGA